MMEHLLLEFILSFLTIDREIIGYFITANSRKLSEKYPLFLALVNRHDPYIFSAHTQVKLPGNIQLEVSPTSPLDEENFTEMLEITDFISKNRENALSLGDYDSYKAQCSHRIKRLRRKLGLISSKSTNHKDRKAITAGDIARDQEYIHLLFLVAERAWADGMYLRSVRSADSTKAITGSTRQHVLSRLSKAARQAEDTVKMLENSASQATDRDIVEAWAYAYSLVGALEFEKQSSGVRQIEGQVPVKQRWKKCLVAYSAARIIYDSLYQSSQKDVFKEMLNTIVDPSIRYAAYQSRLSRTLAISTVAKQCFSRDNRSFISALEAVDPLALSEEPSARGTQSTETVTKILAWRSRTVIVTDITMAEILNTLSSGEAKLAVNFTANSHKYKRCRASAKKSQSAAYDEVLALSQDAADVVRHAIDELEREHVDEGDHQMQDLRIISLVVNYKLIGWRVGRNRVLVGENDGMRFEPAKMKMPRRRNRKTEKEQARLEGDDNDETDVDGNGKKAIAEVKRKANEERRGRKLARLKDRIALYDAIMQSIDSIKELRGALRDASFVAELDGKRAYFQALKCLNISRTHALHHSYAEALALSTRAENLCTRALTSLNIENNTDNPSKSSPSPSDPPSLNLPPSLPLTLHTLLQNTSRYYNAMYDVASTLEREAHADAELGQLSVGAGKKAIGNKTSGLNGEKSSSLLLQQLPVVETMHRFHPAGANMSNIVAYPPPSLSTITSAPTTTSATATAAEVIPAVPQVPIAVDMAWAYIEYPDERGNQKGSGARRGSRSGRVGRSANDDVDMDEGEDEASGSEDESEDETEKEQKSGGEGKKGWFGFWRG